MLAVLLYSCFCIAPIQSSATPQSDIQLDQVVLRAFQSAHDGYSSDEVILNEELNARFISECKKLEAGVDEFECNWKLMNLRKAGKLKSIKTSRRGPRPDQNLFHVAEMVSRSMMDRYQLSIDRIMADPGKRSQFNQEVSRFNNSLDLYSVRKAAFQLRKARQLRPELITRIADWNRKIEKLPVKDLQQDSSRIPEQPGVYIFQDTTGYLYIGQSENLRKRLEQHFEESSNQALFNYLGKDDSHEIFVELHSFPADSRAKELMVRRAYESELIRSRKPKFNILP